VDFDPGEGIRTLTSRGTGGASDIFTAKYSSTGILFWVNSFGAPVAGNGSSSCANVLATDSLSNCLVAGKFYSGFDADPSEDTMRIESNGLSDYFLLKYNHNGKLWKNAPLLDVGSGIVDFGDVYINTEKLLIKEIYNAGDGILYVSSVNPTNQRFSILEMPEYILPSRSFQLVIRFAPVALGLHDGYIVIEHNGENQRDSIHVAGSGDGRPVSLTLHLMPGWNLISLPAQVNDGSKNTLFPEAVSEAFAFTDGTYTTKDTLELTVGYWIKFEDQADVLIEGAARDSATVTVRQGWNMIGCISSTVDVDSIIQQPPGIIATGFFEYDGFYSETETLEPGRSYWVKINSPGTLFFRGSELFSEKTGKLR